MVQNNNGEPEFFDKSGKYKKVFVTYPSVFMNAECMFIEYDDVIKCPYFTYLVGLSGNAALQEIYDLESIGGLSIEELFEWYINREERNIFRNFPVWDYAWEKFFHSNQEEYDKWVEKFLFEDAIEDTPEIVTFDSSLNFVNVLKNLESTKLVSNLYFYSKYKHDIILDDVKSLFTKFNIKYVYGDLTEVLKDNHIPNNSTFVFSDIEKIQNLIDAHCIVGSSVLIADRYQYNYDENGELKIKEEWDKYMFKLDTFNNIYQVNPFDYELSSSEQQ